MLFAMKKVIKRLNIKLKPEYTYTPFQKKSKFGSTCPLDF